MLIKVGVKTIRKTKDDAEKTRRDILKAALAVFSKKGYASTSLEEIAKAAGVTRGAIYWHFDNKAKLYNTLIDEANTKGDIVIAEAMKGCTTFREMCKKILIAQWKLLEEDEEYRAIMILVMFNTGIVPELEESRKILLESSKKVVKIVADHMKLGIESGQLRSDKKPIELSHAFLAYQQGVTVNWLQDPTLFSIKEMAPALADIFIEGIVL